MRCSLHTCQTSNWLMLTRYSSWLMNAQFFWWISNLHVKWSLAEHQTPWAKWVEIRALFNTLNWLITKETTFIKIKSGASLRLPKLCDSLVNTQNQFHIPQSYQIGNMHLCIPNDGLQDGSPYSTHHGKANSKSRKSFSIPSSRWCHRVLVAISWYWHPIVRNGLPLWCYSNVWSLYWRFFHLIAPTHCSKCR